jgi:hypothetical protein
MELEYAKIEETMSPLAMDIIGKWIIEQADADKARR